MSDYNRWVEIESRDVFALSLRKAREIGLKLIDGWKPDMCCWYSFRFRGKPNQIVALEQWWREQKFDWFKRMPRGAWPPRKGEVLDWEEVMKKVSESRQSRKR